MEPREFTSRLQAHLLEELVDDVKKYNPDRLKALEIMLQQTDTQWMSVNEVSKELKVCTATVRRWIKAGKLKSYRAGQKYLVTPDDLRTFLEQQTNET